MQLTLTERAVEIRFRIGRYPVSRKITFARLGSLRRGGEKMMEIAGKSVVLLLTGVFLLFSVAYGGYYLNGDGTPHDMYHYLHLPHDPPLYPTYSKVPKTSFTCAGREWGLHADTEAECQVYHLCQGRVVHSFLCPNATLFHDQFKVCDQFYNVRCGWDLDDL